LKLVKVVAINQSSTVRTTSEWNLVRAGFTFGVAYEGSEHTYRLRIEKEYPILLKDMKSYETIQSDMDKIEEGKFKAYCRKVLKQNGLECDALKEEKTDVIMLKKSEEGEIF